MNAQDRKGQGTMKRPKRKLHTKWAQKFIALYQCKLSDEDREKVEAHLRECSICADAYLVYREVAGIVQERLPLGVPSELPPKLQALKDQQLALAVQNLRKTESPATTKQTLNGVHESHSKKKHPA